jgi:hypothetical protein
VFGGWSTAGTPFGLQPRMSWPRTVGALLLLGSLSVAPVLTWRARVAEVAPPLGPVPGARIATANGRPGVGVELQVLDLRLELAWFESVPVTPGRRLIVSWLASRPRGE